MAAPVAAAEASAPVELGGENHQSVLHVVVSLFKSLHWLAFRFGEVG
jgi:hypothetical protein